MLQIICGTFETGHFSKMLGAKMLLGHPYNLSYNRRFGSYVCYGRVPFSFKLERKLTRLG